MESKAKKISVLHMVSSLLIGGAERFVVDLSQQQNSDGLEAKIYSFGSANEPLVSECSNAGIRVSFNKGWKLFALYRILRKLQRADIIHIHSPHVLRYISPILPFIGLNKIVYTRHGAKLFCTSLWLLIHQFCQRYVHTVAFVSKESKELFEEQYQWNSTNRFVIDNAVLLPECTIEKNKQSQVLRLGSVSRMIDIKNQLSLLEAITKLSPVERERIEVNFFGDGPCKEDLVSFKEAFLPDTKITFHGNVSNREKIYSEIDLLVVTSETEGLSLAIIEAMHSGCAVIATNVGGNPKLVIEGVTGWLFEFNDCSRLARLIKNSIHDRSFVHAYSQNARKMIMDRFSLDACAARYRTIYSSVLGEKQNIIDNESYQNHYNS